MNDLRELNGHPLRVLRAQHNLTLEELARETGLPPQPFRVPKTVTSLAQPSGDCSVNTSTKPRKN